jgi:hypothetical protein
VIFRSLSGLRRAGVLGLNCRNGSYTLKYNNRRFYPLVDDKVLCKRRLQERGLAVPDLIGLVEFNRQASRLAEMLGDYTEFVIKPSHGSGGSGILVITGRRADYFLDNDGKLVMPEDLAHHLTNVIGGLYSLGGQPDVAMIETLVHFDPLFAGLTYHGVPDIRVIVFKGYPVMAMTRLPTRMSHGKANLHQGAIGVGIDLASGVTFRRRVGQPARDRAPGHRPAHRGIPGPALGPHRVDGRAMLRSRRAGLPWRRRRARPGSRPADPRAECPPGTEHPAGQSPRLAQQAGRRGGARLAPRGAGAARGMVPPHVRR